VKRIVRVNLAFYKPSTDSPYKRETVNLVLRKGKRKECTDTAPPEPIEPMD
jgi:hypothetical protein